MVYSGNYNRRDLVKNEYIDYNANLPFPMKTFLCFLIYLLSALSVSYSQSDCNDIVMPDDPDKRKLAETNLAMFSDAMREEINYPNGIKPHQWLLANQPQLNRILYINGAKMFNGLIEKTDNEQQKLVYVDSLMLVYDMRIEYCGGEAEVTARKAYDSYKHTIRNTDRLPANLELFDKAIELNGDNIPSYMLLPYMNVIRYNYQVKKNITDEDVTRRYERLVEIMDAQPRDESLDKIREAIDGVYISLILGANPENLDCATIKQKLVPKYEANPSDLKMTKLIFSLMTKNGCTTDPLWLELGEIVVKEDPSYRTMRTLAQVALSNGDVARAERLIKEGLRFAQSNEDKSDANLRLAAIEKEKGSFASARNYFRKALETDPSNKTAYSGIGMLYFQSFERCKQEKNKVHDRLVFLAAYDKFVAGGNMDMAAQAKEQFPSKVEIFEQDYQAGEEMNTGCWMNESVILRTRD